MLQHSIKESVEIEGVGLHTGKKSKIVFNPAKPSSGIVFIRKDLEGNPRIRAEISNVSSTNRGTSLKSANIEIFTVEHVLAALFGLGIDNAEVFLFGCEPPNLDGSAMPYIELLKKAGLVILDQEECVITLKKAVKVSQGKSSIEAYPNTGFKIDFMINYPDTFIGEQSFSYEEKNDVFEKEIAPARTFGFLEEIESLKSKGLALGATYDNALVLKKDGFVNNPRWDNEPVRHKILDLIGDLSLLGARLKAHIVARMSGHELNIKLAREIKKIST